MKEKYRTHKKKYKFFFIFLIFFIFPILISSFGTGLDEVEIGKEPISAINLNISLQDTGDNNVVARVHSKEFLNYQQTDSWTNENGTEIYYEGIASFGFSVVMYTKYTHEEAVDSEPYNLKREWLSVETNDRKKDFGKPDDQEYKIHKAYYNYDGLVSSEFNEDEAINQFVDDKFPTLSDSFRDFYIDVLSSQESVPFTFTQLYNDYGYKPEIKAVGYDGELMFDSIELDDFSDQLPNIELEGIKLKPATIATTGTDITIKKERTNINFLDYNIHISDTSQIIDEAQERDNHDVDTDEPGSGTNDFQNWLDDFDFTQHELPRTNPQDQSVVGGGVGLEIMDWRNEGIPTTMIPNVWFYEYESSVDEGACQYDNVVTWWEAHSPGDGTFFKDLGKKSVVDTRVVATEVDNVGIVYDMQLDMNLLTTAEVEKIDGFGGVPEAELPQGVLGDVYVNANLLREDFDITQTGEKINWLKFLNPLHWFKSIFGDITGTIILIAIIGIGLFILIKLVMNRRKIAQSTYKSINTRK
jgi:hypothetical protein